MQRWLHRCFELVQPLGGRSRLQGGDGHQFTGTSSTLEIHAPETTYLNDTSKNRQPSAVRAARIAAATLHALKITHCGSLQKKPYSTSIYIHKIVIRVRYQRYVFRKNVFVEVESTNSREQRHAMCLLSQGEIKKEFALDH